MEKIIDSFILKNKWLIIVIIFGAAIVPYLNIFNNEFAYDDGDFFLRWEGIKNINISSFFAGDAPLYQYHVYRPLRTVLQSFVYALFKTNPLGYHFFSLLIHLINTFLVFLIAKKISNKFVALITAVIFGLLPIHVMSVAFITASFNTAGIVLILGSFYLYLLAQEKHQKKFLYFSWFLALLALFTYELSLILLLLIILYDGCIRKLKTEQFKSQIKYYLPYFFLSLFFIIIRQSIIGKIYTKSLVIEINFFSRMLTMSKAVVKYLYLVVFNYPLSVYQDVKISNSLFDFNVFASFLIILSLIGLAVFFYRRNLKIYSFVILWFFISLIPYSNIIPIAFFVSEQYLYLASFGWALLIGLLFYQLFGLAKKKSFLVGGICFLIGLCLIYGCLTWLTNKKWQNDFVLWATTIKEHPDYVKAYNNLGFYYKTKSDYDSAKEYFEKAIAINPNYSLAYLNLGEIFMDQGQFARAIDYFNQVISLRQTDVTAYHNLGFCYHSLGKISEAELNYKKALEIYPKYYQTNKNLAVLYLSQKRYKESIPLFQQAIAVQKDDFELYFGLGLCYLNQGEKTTAKEYFQKTLKIKPDFAPAEQILNQL